MGMNMGPGSGGPPNGMMGMNAGTPPAKRPRFEHSVRPGMNGPGMGGGGGGGGGMNARPPSAGPAGGYSTGRPPQGMGGNTGPSPARPPIVRPPIHLGMGGPPPPGMGIAPRGPGPVSVNAIAVPRPGMRGRGGPAPAHGHGHKSVVSVPGAPRGPSGMGIRARDASGAVGGGLGKRAAQDERDRDRKRREREREREARNRDRDGDAGVKATMTDFRIVGMEVKGAEGQVWTWGLTGEEATKLHPVREEEKDKGKEETKAEGVDGKEVKSEEVKGDDGSLVAPAAVPLERSVSGDEEERSRKRKADSPDDGELYYHLSD